MAAVQPSSDGVSASDGGRSAEEGDGEPSPRLHSRKRSLHQAASDEPLASGDSRGSEGAGEDVATELGAAQCTEESGECDREPSESAPEAANSESEKQIRVSGLNKWTTKKQVKAHLEALGVAGIRKLKKFDHQDFAFVYFESVQQRHHAETVITGHNWRGQTLSTKQANPLDPERWAKKHCREGSTSHSQGADVGLATLKSAADCVAPLRGMRYEEQLDHKRTAVLRSLRKLPDAMRMASKGTEWNRWLP